jgi:hypothetical protein
MISNQYVYDLPQNLTQMNLQWSLLLGIPTRIIVDWFRARICFYINWTKISNFFVRKLLFQFGRHPSFRLVTTRIDWPKIKHNSIGIWYYGLSLPKFSFLLILIFYVN